MVNSVAYILSKNVYQDNPQAAINFGLSQGTQIVYMKTTNLSDGLVYIDSRLTQPVYGLGQYYWQTIGLLTDGPGGENLIYINTDGTLYID
jgi:hypothetical protein